MSGLIKSKDESVEIQNSDSLCQIYLRYYITVDSQSFEIGMELQNGFVYNEIEIENIYSFNILASNSRYDSLNVVKYHCFKCISYKMFTYESILFIWNKMNYSETYCSKKNYEKVEFVTGFAYTCWLRWHYKYMVKFSLIH